MAGTMDRRDRQAIVDGYLAETGRDVFRPAEFVEWLEPRSDHPAWGWYFGKGDAEAAHRWRVDEARRMIAGLRIRVAVQTPGPRRAFRVVTREMPAFVSPVSERRAGGGYRAFDPADPDQMTELLRQAGAGLASWLRRYGGAAEAAGHDLRPVESLSQALDAAAALARAAE